MLQFFKTNAQKFKDYSLQLTQNLWNDYINIREKSKDLTKTNLELGQFHLKHGHITDAILRFRITLFLNPALPHAHYELARCYILKESNEKAIIHLQKAIELSSSPYPEASFLLAKLDHHLPTPNTIPLSLIEEHFNEIASDYQLKIQENHYQGHFLIRKMLLSTSSHEASTSTLLNVLDIGCGTGLCGGIVRELFPNSVVTGIDIAENMIFEAHNSLLPNESPVYYQLIKAEAHHYLQQHHPIFQLIVAGYTLHFIGDLHPLFELVFEALDSKGKFVFTIGKSEQSPFTLLPDFEHFAHHSNYIEETAKKVGFSHISYEAATIYDENEGYVFLLQK